MSLMGPGVALLRAMSDCQSRDETPNRTDEGRSCLFLVLKKEKLFCDGYKVTRKGRNVCSSVAISK